MKPHTAMRHQFVTAGRRTKPPTTVTKSNSSTLGGRSKQVLETPKKSLIGAPTPLTARSSRTTTTNGGPTTPNNSHSQPIPSGSSQTSRSYRASQTQSLSSFHSSRTLGGYAVSEFSLKNNSSLLTLEFLPVKYQQMIRPRYSILDPCCGCCCISFLFPLSCIRRYSCIVFRYNITRILNKQSFGPKQIFYCLELKVYQILASPASSRHLNLI